MVRVITAGRTARVLLDSASIVDDLGEVVVGVKECADSGVEELLITVPRLTYGWFEILEEALLGTADDLRIIVSVGDPEAEHL